MPRIEFQPRDLLWLTKGSHYGPMPRSYYVAFNKQSKNGDNVRLTDLKKAGYFYNPIKEHNLFANGRHTGQEVLAVTEQADNFLLSKNLLQHRTKPLKPANIRHELFLASALTSIELSLLERGDQYLSEFELKDRMKSNTRAVQMTITDTRNEWDRDHRGWCEVVDSADTALHSDGYFIKKNADGYLACFLEVDRGSESHYKTDLSKESWRAKLLKYRKLIGEGVYKDHFGISCGAYALFLFSDRSDMEAIQALLEDQTEKKGYSYMLFKTWQEFNQTSFVPKEINRALVSDPWLRVGDRAPVYL